jgi:hypothetical protein
MAKTRRQNPAKSVGRISADVRRLGPKRRYPAKFSEDEELAIRKAITQLGGHLKELEVSIHTWWWFGRRK